MFSAKYIEQVSLLVRTLPFVADEKCFALKGGTAINLFVRDMPRLSVDIDLTYLPIEPREDTLSKIDAALRRIAATVRDSNPDTEIDIEDKKSIINFNVRQGTSIVKVEVSPVTRGCLFPPELKHVRPAVEEKFGYAELPVVSFADLYAGKLCAALDRQHPRDLYDVMLLLDNEGLSRRLVQALMIYIACNKQPMNEIIAPNWLDIDKAYTNHFVGMTREAVPLETLKNTRERLLDEIARYIEPQDIEFLLSLKRKAPNWDLLGIPDVSKLPAIQWKLHNIGKMAAESHATALKKLDEALKSMLERKQRLALQDEIVRGISDDDDEPGSRFHP